MEINRALSLIYSHYGHFDFLPEDMLLNITKNDFLVYLKTDNANTNVNAIDDKAIETFLNVIYDENEENRECIPRSSFDSKYNSLLKLIEDEDESIGDGNVVNNNDNRDKGIDKNSNDANHNVDKEYITKTPQKDAPLVELGSPIPIKNSNHKINNDLSIEAIELFKDIKFKDEKIKKQKLNFDSIVRPSNNFNFNTNTDDPNKYSKNNVNDGLLKEIHLKQSPRNIINNIGKEKYIKGTGVGNSNQTIFKSKGLKNMYNHSKPNFNNTPNKTYSIQQKLQEVYNQIHQPNNNEYNSYSISPIKLQQHHQFHHNYAPMTGIMSSNNPIVNEDYFAKIYREINSANATKSINRKVNQFINKEKRNELYQHYARVNRPLLNQKFDGLNQMLNFKSNGFASEDKVLNEDDFVTLEDKMSQFALMKKGLGAKTNDSYGKLNYNTGKDIENDNEFELSVSKNNLNKALELEHKEYSDAVIDNNGVFAL